MSFSFFTSQMRTWYPFQITSDKLQVYQPWTARKLMWPRSVKFDITRFECFLWNIYQWKMKAPFETRRTIWSQFVFEVFKTLSLPVFSLIFVQDLMHATLNSLITWESFGLNEPKTKYISNSHVLYYREATRAYPAPSVTVIVYPLREIRDRVKR